MTEQQHPVKLLPGLVQLWRRNWNHAHGEFSDYLATQAARWGADQELEACVEWAANTFPLGTAKNLRAARRPKPPSLAEQALDAAEDMSDCMNDGFVPNRSSLDTIRRALVRLKELEQQENNDN